MQHFPIFLSVAGRRIVVAGGGETALAKLRLLLKTKARINVFAATPEPEVERLAAAGHLSLIRRPLEAGDALCAALFYAAHDDEDIDHIINAIKDSAAEMRADGLIDGRADSRDYDPQITAAPPRLSLPGGEARIAQDMAAPLAPLACPRSGVVHRMNPSARIQLPLTDLMVAETGRGRPAGRHSCRRLRGTAQPQRSSHRVRWLRLCDGLREYPDAEPESGIETGE